MCTNFGERIKSEREKTGLNQENFGSKCGVSKRTQINYESGLRKPDIEYLRNFNDLGCDADYVIYGQPSRRNPNHDIDAIQLSDAIETVMNIFERINRVPRDRKHLAQIITAVYELYVENGRSNSQEETILRLIKAAS